MKVSLLIVWCILCTWVTNAQKISFSGQVCRFDTITESDGPVVHDFYFTNTGEKPLKIKEVLTSCGCVAASFPSGEVMPGGKAAVRVIYRPENRHEEEVLAIADVYTNAGVRTLEISGVVLRSKKERQPAYRLRESDVREYVRPSKPARGFGLILERMREGLLARVNVPENDAEVKEQVAALDRGGKWADLDYACYGRTNWEPIRHLQRVYQQVLSYVNPESIYYANDTLYTVIRDALGYWLECRPKCHNWWYNQIAVPQCLGNMLVLMECGKKRLSGELRDGLFRLMAWPDPRRWTGANKQDIALHHVQRGCLLENDSIVKAAVDDGNTDEYQPCTELWGDLLQKAPFNVSLNAHTHQYAFYPKGAAGNNFPVFIGGGYSLKEATVMVLTKKGRQLKIKVINVAGEILKEMEL